MTKQQAKEILMLYRPGTADTQDPEFGEALALCQRDAELKSWFDHHCAVYAVLRSKFKRIPVPEGLKEQIIAERRVHTVPLWQRAVLAAGALAVLALVIFELAGNIHLPEPKNFATYRNYMGSFASRAYGMDLNTSDLNAIRRYFAQTNAIADYVLPDNLQKNAQPTGCVATTWRGNKVSMICFQSGQPLARPGTSDLWLFVSEPTIAKDAPKASTPVIATANGIVSASWTEGNRTYILAMEGTDEQLLKKFLPDKAVL